MRPDATTRPFRAAALLTAALGVSGCAVLNAPLLAIHSVGMHYKTRAVDVAPFYTPGGRLAYAAEGRMWIEPEPGAAAVLIPDARRGTEWLKSDDPVMTPDSERIYFTSGVEMHTSEGAHSDHVWQVYSMAPGGEDIRRESFSRRKESELALSPDGRWLAQVRRTEFRPYALDGPAWGRADVVLIDLQGERDEDGNLPVRSLTGPLFDEYLGLSFRPDGAELVFAARNEGEPFAIYRLAASSGEGELVPPERWIEGGTLPVYAPDGSSLYYVGPAAEPTESAPLDLWRRDVGTGADEALGVPMREGRNLAVAPDGARLAVCIPDKRKVREYVLLELDLGAGTRREVTRILARSAHMFKPLDYIHPIY